MNRYSILHRAVAALVSVTLFGARAFAQAPSNPSEPAAGSAAAEVAAPRPLAETLTGEALSSYESGRILFADGDHAGAALKFRAAYDASGDYRLLWNVAVCEKNQRQYTRVLELVERYLRDGEGKLSEADRAEAQTLVDAVKAFVAEVHFQVTPAEADIYVDGELVGRSPLTLPVTVNMGQHEIRAAKPGHEERTTTVMVEGGKDATVSLMLPLLAPPEGRLRVVAEPGAEIWVNGQLVGTNDWEGRLPPGAAHLRVTASGKRPYETEVVVREDQLVTSRVTLESVAQPMAALTGSSSADEGGSPWLWIVGGAVLVAGLGVGGYLLLRPDEEQASRTVAGTIPPGVIQLSLSR